MRETNLYLVTHRKGGEDWYEWHTWHEDLASAMDDARGQWRYLTPREAKGAEILVMYGPAVWECGAWELPEDAYDRYELVDYQRGE